MPKNKDIVYNENQVINTYNLLKQAYGDDFNVTYEDYADKVKREDDPKVDQYVTSLLKNAYPDRLSSLKPEEFRQKLYLDQEKERLYEIKKEEEKIKKELGPDYQYQDDNKLKKIATKVIAGAIPGVEEIKDEEKLPENIQKEKELKRLEAEKGRLNITEQVQANVNQMDDNTYDKIGNAENFQDVQNLTDPNTFNYIKKQKESEIRKKEYDQQLVNTYDPNYHLSIYNQQRLGLEVKNNPEIRQKLADMGVFEKRDYDDVVELVNQAAYQYARDKDPKDVKKFFAIVAPYLLYDEKGNPTPFAIQNSAKLLSDQVNGSILALNPEIEKQYKLIEKDKAEKGKTARKGDFSYASLGSNMSATKNIGNPIYDDYEKLLKEKGELQEIARILDKTILRPTKRAGFAGLAKGMEEVDWLDQATIGLKSMADAVDLKRLSDKFQSGEQLTKSEQLMLDAVSLNQFIVQTTNPGMWYNVSGGIAQMPSYMVGFAMSGGVYSATKAGVKKAFGIAAKEAAEKAAGTAAKKGLRTAIPGAIATIPATIANPSTSVIKNASEKMTNLTDLVINQNVGDIAGEFIDETGEDPVKAIAKGASSAYFENLFERSGEYIMKGFGEGFTGAGKKLAQKNWAQKYLLANYSKLKDLKTDDLSFPIDKFVAKEIQKRFL